MVVDGWLHGLLISYLEWPTTDGIGSQNWSIFYGRVQNSKYPFPHYNDFV